MTTAVLEASQWIDASLQNKTKMAETVADKSYVNTSVDAINQRILGRYQNGLGKTWDDPNHMKFFNDGAVNFPYLSDGMWFLTQHKRWGLLKEHPDYLAVAKQINQIDLYKQAAAATEDQRAEGVDALQQADRRRRCGTARTRQVRRLVQGPRRAAQPEGDTPWSAPSFIRRSTRTAVPSPANVGEPAARGGARALHSRAREPPLRRA